MSVERSSCRGPQSSLYRVRQCPTAMVTSPHLSSGCSLTCEERGQEQGDMYVRDEN